MVLSDMSPVKGALMRASAGQCGMDSAGCSASTMDIVAGLDHRGSVDKEGASEGSLLCAATLYSFGLPFEYARLENLVRPETWAYCNAPRWDRAVEGSRADIFLAWQCHIIRCGGDGRRL